MKDNASDKKLQIIRIKENYPSVCLARVLKSSSCRRCGVFPMLNLNIASLAISSGKGM